MFLKCLHTLYFCSIIHNIYQRNIFAHKTMSSPYLLSYFFHISIFIYISINDLQTLCLFIKQTFFIGNFLFYYFSSRICLYTTENIELSAFKTIPLCSTIHEANQTEKKQTVWTKSLLHRPSTPNHLTEGESTSIFLKLPLQLLIFLFLICRSLNKCSFRCFYPQFLSLLLHLPH